MKKIFYVLTLAAVVATAACSDDEKGMSEEQLYQAQNNDLSGSGLFGSVKRAESRSYSIDGIEWDSINKKPATTPTKVSTGYVVELSNAGYRTLSSSTRNVVTGAKVVGDDIVITSSEQRPQYEYKYTYDSKNRVLSDEYFSYSYTVSSGDYSWSGNNWAGDTLFYAASTKDDFKLMVDTSYAEKEETTYDDAAKTATIISYDWSDGKWEPYSKVVRTLNKYGYLDDNSSSETFYAKLTATEFESKPSSGSYKVLDGQGNWTEYYRFSMSTDWSGPTPVSKPILNSYETRDITYY